MPVIPLHKSNPRPELTAFDWPELKEQLLRQWDRLSENELDAAGPNMYDIALLIERDYGLSPRTVENYLRNFERTMPLKTATSH